MRVGWVGQCEPRIEAIVINAGGGGAGCEPRVIVKMQKSRGGGSGGWVNVNQELKLL